MCVLFELFFVVLLLLLLSDEPNDKSDRSKWSMMCWCDVIFWPWHQLFFPSLLFSRRTDFLSLLFFFFSLFEMWTGPIKASFKLEIRFDSIRFPFEFEWLNQSGLCVWVRAWDVKRINWLETRFDLTGLDWSWFDWTGLDWKFLIDWLIVGFTMWTPRKNKYGTVLGTNTGLLVGVYVCVRVCGCLLICGYTRCTNDNESDSIRLIRFLWSSFLLDLYVYRMCRSIVATIFVFSVVCSRIFLRMKAISSRKIMCVRRLICDVQESQLAT